MTQEYCIFRCRSLPHIVTANFRQTGLRATLHVHRITHDKGWDSFEKIRIEYSVSEIIEYSNTYACLLYAVFHKATLCYLAARLAVAGETAICFSPVPFLLVGLDPKPLDNGSQPTLNEPPRNCTNVRCGVKAENILSKIFLPTLKFGMGKPQIYLKLSRTAANRKRVTSKRLNISTNT